MMSSEDLYEAKVAEIERTGILLEHMEQKVEEMEKALGKMFTGDTSESEKQRDERRKSIDKTLEWISTKYDEMISKELELCEADEQGDVWGTKTETDQPSQEV